MATFFYRTVEGPRLVEGMSVSDRMFWSHYRGPNVGVNLFKLTDGTYTEAQPEDPDDVAVWYLGGHYHTVDDDEAAALSSAGYGAWLTGPLYPSVFLFPASDLYPRSA